MGKELVGREAEIASLSRFLDAVCDGPTALLLEGEAGIGKTTLWRNAVSEAAARSYRTLTCQPAQTETKLSFTALTDLLDPALDEALPGLPAPQRRALDVALLRADPGSEPPDQRAVSVALLSVVTRLVESGPVVIAIDDVQWLDRPTARVLEFAIRRLRDQPVGVLVSLRTAGGQLVPLALDRALGDTRVHRVPVGPFSLAALHRLLTSRLGRAFSRPTLVRIEQASGGNPFFALEIARVLLQSGTHLPPWQALPVPGTLRELVTDRIGALPASTRHVC